MIPALMNDTLCISPLQGAEGMLTTTMLMEETPFFTYPPEGTTNQITERQINPAAITTTTASNYPTTTPNPNTAIPTKKDSAISASSPSGPTPNPHSSTTIGATSSESPISTAVTQSVTAVTERIAGVGTSLPNGDKGQDTTIFQTLSSLSSE